MFCDVFTKRHVHNSLNIFALISVCIDILVEFRGGIHCAKLNFDDLKVLEMGPLSPYSTGNGVRVGYPTRMKYTQKI